MQKNSKEWLKNIPLEKGYYFAGFTDGEGSFNVSLRKRIDHNIGWQVILTFNVSQKEEYILAQFKKIIGCGRLQRRKDGINYFVVSNPLSIFERVIPFFEKFNFLSLTKKRNFTIFKQIVRLVKEKQHLNQSGLKKITQLREELNKGKGRKRKYNIKDIEQYFQENPQRLYVRPRLFRKEESKKT